MTIPANCNWPMCACGPRSSRETCHHARNAHNEMMRRRLIGLPAQDDTPMTADEMREAAALIVQETGDEIDMLLSARTAQALFYKAASDIRAIPIPPDPKAESEDCNMVRTAGDWHDKAARGALSDALLVRTKQANKLAFLLEECLPYFVGISPHVMRDKIHAALAEYRAAAPGGEK